MMTKETIGELRDSWGFNEQEIIEWGHLEALLTRHVAALAGRLGIFVARMSKADRDFVIEETLWESWLARGDLGRTFVAASSRDNETAHAYSSSLLAWWTARIKYVLTSRPGWYYEYSTHRAWMPSKTLVAGIT